METVIYAPNREQFPDDADVYYDKKKEKWFMVVKFPRCTRYIAGKIKQIQNIK